MRLVCATYNCFEFDKNANSGDCMLCVLRPISHSVSLATIGVCVFCAVTSVAALFIYGGEIMSVIINILAFIICGIALLSLFFDINYRLFCSLIIIAVILKGITIVFGKSDSENQ